MEGDFFLIQKMKYGDEKALEQFVQKYYPLILSYCRYRLGQKELAEDLTQETFERFFRSFPAYRHEGKLPNYLYVIAGNLCRDAAKKKKEWPAEELYMEEEGRLNTAEEDMDLREGIRKLPEELKEAVLLYYFQDLKLKEVAGILGIGLPLVKYRLRRAKALLKEYLSEEDAV